jgi:hypothetical protein
MEAICAAAHAQMVRAREEAEFRKYVPEDQQIEAMPRVLDAEILGSGDAADAAVHRAERHLHALENSLSRDANIARNARSNAERLLRDERARTANEEALAVALAPLVEAIGAIAAPAAVGGAAQPVQNEDSNSAGHPVHEEVPEPPIVQQETVPGGGTDTATEGTDEQFGEGPEVNTFRAQLGAAAPVLEAVGESKEVLLAWARRSRSDLTAAAYTVQALTDAAKLADDGNPGPSKPLTAELELVERCRVCSGCTSGGACNARACTDWPAGVDSVPLVSVEATAPSLDLHALLRQRRPAKAAQELEPPSTVLPPILEDGGEGLPEDETPFKECDGFDTLAHKQSEKLD